jgi:hypothetical protein
LRFAKEKRIRARHRHPIVIVIAVARRHRLPVVAVVAAIATLAALPLPQVARPPKVILTATAIAQPVQAQLVLKSINKRADPKEVGVE